MNYLQVKNWQEWQSYRKDRGTPPWIKVHRCLLSNPKWAILSDAEKGQLVSIWIVAADNGGQIPDDNNIIRKICQLDTPPNLNKFKDLGFFENSGLPTGNHVVTTPPQIDAPETETEVYSKEVEKNIDRFENFWDAYGYKVGKDKSKIAYTKAIKSGVDHNEIIRGVIRYQQDCQARGISGKYIKQPTTWLNGKHWEDEYPKYVESRARTVHDDFTTGIKLALAELDGQQEY